MNLRPSVGLTDVAKAAGVSSSTASRALRGESRVSPETVARVRDVADRLGYVPDKRAVNLRSRAPAAVGLILRSAELSFYGAIAARMQSAVNAHGVDLLIANGGDDHTTQMRAIESLVGHRVAGLVFASGRASIEAVGNAASSVPTVLVGAESPQDGVDSVCISGESEVKMAESVIAAGHARVAVTRSTTPGTSVLQLRTERYESTLRGAGVEVLRLTKDDDPAQLRDGLRGALAGGATAVMAGDDLTALQILELLDEWGVRCPAEVSVTGFDGVGVLTSPLLGLTTMRQPVAELASTATELILSRLGHSGRATSRTRIPGQFVPGRTLAPPAPR